MDKETLERIRNRISKLKTSAEELSATVKTHLPEKTHSSEAITRATTASEPTQREFLLREEENRHKIAEYEHQLEFLNTKLRYITQEKSNLEEELKELLKNYETLQKKFSELETEKKSLVEENKTLLEKLSALDQTNWIKFSLDLIQQFITEFCRHFRTSRGMVTEIVDLCLSSPQIPEELKSKIKLFGQIDGIKMSDVLEEAKAKYTFTVLSIQTVDLHTVLENAISAIRLRTQTQKQKIDFNIKFSSERINVNIDVKLFTEMLNAILTNAIEAIIDSGIVNIETKTTNNAAIIEISDNGCGIPEHLLNKVFNPFFTTKENHLGLGLTRAYWIAKLHSGDIEISSLGVYPQPNHGTKVTIILPISIG